MGVLDLIPDNYEPISAGAATEDPATLSDVTSAAWNMSRDNYNVNTSAKIIADLQDKRGELYHSMENKLLLGNNYSQSSPILSAGTTQDSGDFTPLFTPTNYFKPITDVLSVDLWGMAQRLHKDDTYVNLHIKELRAQNPAKYAGLLTNEEIEEEARKQAQLSKTQFELVGSRASKDAAFWGGIIGSFGGAMSDPLNVVTLPIGASAATGVLRAMGTEAAIQAGVEVVSQPSVMAWQEELGQEYGLGDATTNVFAAATLGGAFTGLVRGVKPTAQAAFSLMQKSEKLNSLQKRSAGYMSRYAHFSEANPNPRIVSEIHSETVDAASKITRTGKNISTAELPMTNRLFNSIDTANLKGATAQQTSTLRMVEKFQDHVGDIPDGAVNVIRGYDDVDKMIQDAIEGNNDLLRVPTRAQEAQQIKLADISKQLDEIENKITPIKDGGELTPKQTSKLSRLEGKRNKLLDEQVAIKSQPELPFTNPKQTAKIARAFNAVKKADDPKFDKRFKAKPEDVPSNLDTDQPTLNNKETTELLERVESVDNQKAQDVAFKQLVEQNADEVVTLEDGTTKTLRELSEEFAEDEKFLNEITTCAV